MTDLRDANAMTETTTGKFSWPRAARSIAASIVLNAVCPFLIFRALTPLYPDGDLTPLLASTVFPVFGLVFGAIRARLLDTIALISLVEIGITIAVTLAARDIRFALVARALQGTLTGLFFLFTAAINRPLLYYVARQFVAASSPQAMEGFELAQARDGGRTFKRLTVAWGLGTILVSVVNVVLAATASPANYLLISPILGIGTNVILIAITIRYSSSRLRAAALR